MTTPEQVGAVAGKLTEGQKRVLVRAEPTVDGRILVPTFLGSLNSSVGWPRGTVAYYSAHYQRLTPLGLQVRDYLNKEMDAHG